MSTPLDKRQQRLKKYDLEKIHAAIASGGIRALESSIASIPPEDLALLFNAQVENPQWVTTDVDKSQALRDRLSSAYTKGPIERQQLVVRMLDLLLKKAQITPENSPDLMQRAAYLGDTWMLERMMLRGWRATFTVASSAFQVITAHGLFPHSPDVFKALAKVLPEKGEELEQAGTIVANALVWCNEPEAAASVYAALTPDGRKLASRRLFKAFDRTFAQNVPAHLKIHLPKGRKSASAKASKQHSWGTEVMDISKISQICKRAGLTSEELAWGCRTLPPIQAEMLKRVLQQEALEASVSLAPSAQRARI